jgi:hypothetical protein
MLVLSEKGLRMDGMLMHFCVLYALATMLISIVHFIPFHNPSFWVARTKPFVLTKDAVNLVNAYVRARVSLKLYHYDFHIIRRRSDLRSSWRKQLVRIFDYDTSSASVSSSASSELSPLMPCSFSSILSSSKPSSSVVYHSSPSLS